MGGAANLSERQRQILEYIRSCVQDRGYPPSVREIGEAIGLKSSSSVHSHLQSLEKKGYLTRSSSSARALTLNEDSDHSIDGAAPRREGDAGIRASGAAYGAEGNATGSSIGSISGNATSSFDGGAIGSGIGRSMANSPEDEVIRNIVPIPLVGKVAAGTPILAEQNVEETLGLPKQIVGDGNSFLLAVSGESMVDAGILDGDIVVVAEQHTANNGDIVVAMLDDEATVKTFYKEDGRVRLQPQNQTMDPIYATDVTILGKVTALFRTIR